MKRLVVALSILTVTTCMAVEIETVDSSPVAEGGDYIRRITIDEHNWSYIHVFTNASAVQTFRSTAGWPMKVRYLVVGGGGRGGDGTAKKAGGGGGGGGGVAEVEGVPFAAGASWRVCVGKGAVEQSTQAGGSSISNSVNEICVVPGGGSGGHGTSSTDYVPPVDGAAGGGAAVLGTSTSRGAAGTFASFVLNMTPPTGGYSGGKSYSYAGGGGGGAGEAGGDATKGDGLFCAGNGGEGLESDITGEQFVYGSGGGGGCINATSNKGPGGAGGTNAGDGGGMDLATSNTLSATAAIPNSGAGGGGGCATAKFEDGTTGADGIVVIRYDYSDYPCVGGDWVKVIPKSANKMTFIHVFTNVQGSASFFNRSGKDLKMRYLVVGGGGAGGSGSGNYPGGGGGGGGVAESNRVVFAAGSEWMVRVGAGSTEELTQAGGSSISNGINGICVVPGGGSGGCGNNSDAAPKDGAAGGGGAPYSGSTGNPGASGTFASHVLGMTPPTGGYSGGASRSFFAGGGGGAGAAGSQPESGQGGGKGGEGLVSDITGEEFVYGSGGGGGAVNATSNYGPGGNGGTNAGNGGGVVGRSGSTESGTPTAATSPVPNSGAGGGGAGAGGNSPSGYKSPTMGADGIVVIRYDYCPVDPGLILIFR